jgi:general secretion pathway protein C
MGSWAIMALNAALLGGCCFLVANIVTQVAGEAIEPDAIDTSGGARQERPENQQASASPSVILDRNLFGAQISGQTQVVETTDEPLTRTKLPLRLLGTAAASEDTRSRAAIEDEKTRKHMVVAVGDTIQGHNRVRVDGIERTRVILDNAGRPEELLLFEDQPRPAPRVAARPKREARRRPTGATAAVQDRLKKLSGNDGDGIAKLLSQARISPHYAENGQGGVLGMKVEAIKQGSVFETAGLKDGDVITEINGIVIDRQEATSAVLDELLNAETIEIAAERGGSSIQLSADAADLMEQP